MRTILCKLCQSVPRPKLGPTTIRVEGCTIGSCAQRNAQKRAQRADVKRIVAELRAPVADKLEITLSLLIERADMIFRQAMATGQFNAAISALKELGVLTGKRGLAPSLRANDSARAISSRPMPRPRLGARTTKYVGLASVVS
jgi:hypothetical protein